MDGMDALDAYRALSVRYHTDVWTEPVGVAAHLQTLRALLSDGVAGACPGRFVYDRMSIASYIADWTDFRRQLADAAMDVLVRERVMAEVDEHLRRAAVLAGGRDDAYAAFEADHVGVPEAGLVELARAILAGDLAGVRFAVCAGGDAELAAIFASDMRERMARALAAYGLDGWTAVVDAGMTARSSVNGPLRRVRVRADTAFTPLAADRLLAHEIGGHVLRWANSQDQPEGWVSVAMGRTVPTEEGMAAWREVEFGLNDVSQLRVYAARVVAVDAARRCGIVDVARLVAPYVGIKAGAEIAVRTKRGLLDPNAPGGQTKDWGYLAGLLAMSDLAVSDPGGLRLMAGVKWPLEDADLVTQLARKGRVLPPSRLPDAGKLGLSTITTDAVDESEC